MILCYSSHNARLCSILAFCIGQKHQPTQTVPVVGEVSREALQTEVHQGPTSPLRTAESRKMLPPLKVCSTWKQFSFSFLNFLASFGSVHHFLCLLFLFSPNISEVLEVCVYVNVYLHIAACSCMHQILCSTNPVSDVLLLPLN